MAQKAAEKDKYEETKESMVEDAKGKLISLIWSNPIIL